MLAAKGRLRVAPRGCALPLTAAARGALSWCRPGRRNGAPTEQRNKFATNHYRSDMASFGQWSYSTDRNATERAYSKAEKGGADTCNCVPCRNFRKARTIAFPAAFLTLLDQLGIDPSKDGEVYHNGRNAPGRHDYAGWFHFVGELAETGDFAPVSLAEGFTAWMCRAGAPRLASLEGLAAVQLEFHAEGVPWLLNEPEPT